jgi:hypothetical protein
MTRPCLVISIVLPCSTRANMALGLSENSRTDTVLTDDFPRRRPWRTAVEAIYSSSGAHPE